MKRQKSLNKGTVNVVYVADIDWLVRRTRDGLCVGAGLRVETRNTCTVEIRHDGYKTRSRYISYLVRERAKFGWEMRRNHLRENDLVQMILCGGSHFSAWFLCARILCCT